MGREGGRRSRRAALRRGRFAEGFAALALRCKGYRIVERNFRCPMGEIDIIARRGRMIAFVEVKARPSLGDALDAVGPIARRRIENAAEAWIARQEDCDRLSWRFDIVAARPLRWPIHLQDAF